jgi:mannose-6-phosphate isomerase-like protein (cupin superfamily)
MLREATIRRVEKPWGHEYIIEIGDELKLKVIHVKHEQCTSMQYHDEKVEMLFPCEGNGRIVEQDGVTTANAVTGTTIEPGFLHQVIGELLYLEVCVGGDDDIHRVNDSYGRADA